MFFCSRWTAGSIHIVDYLYAVRGRFRQLGWGAETANALGRSADVAHVLTGPVFIILPTPFAIAAHLVEWFFPRLLRCDRCAPW